MSLEAARNLSIPELLHVLNENLHWECNGLREYHPPPAISTASLKAEVSTQKSAYLSDRGSEILHTYRNPPDQNSRIQNTRCPKTHSLVAEPATACKQVTTGDPFAHRSTLPARRYRRGNEAGYSIDPRMPVLAQLHHIAPRQLDSNIQLQQEPDDIDP